MRAKFFVFWKFWFFHTFWMDFGWMTSEISIKTPKCDHFLANSRLVIFENTFQKVWKNKIFKKQKICHAFRYIRSCSPNTNPWRPFSSDISRRKKCYGYPKMAKIYYWNCFGEHFLIDFPLEICDKKSIISEISKINPTLRSCISELKKYFAMGPIPLQRSMSKLSNEPNTIKNGHLAQKLRAIEDSYFSENSLSQHQVLWWVDNF